MDETHETSNDASSRWSRRRVIQSIAAISAAALPLPQLISPASAQAQGTADPYPAGWSSRRVQVGNVGIHFRHGGSGAPLVLLHGWPQHSLMWHTIGPQLAKHFTVIAPDQRGVGMSTITPTGYDKTTLARDLAGVLDALGVGECYLAGYDLGAGTAAAFAREYPQRVKRVAFLEFGLAGFGYEQFMNPSPDWTLNSNWHLALFTVPDAAVWMLTGRERELLAWFFHHFAYSGNASVSAAHFDAYVREVSQTWRPARGNQLLRSRVARREGQRIAQTIAVADACACRGWREFGRSTWREPLETRCS